MDIFSFCHSQRIVKKNKKKQSDVQCDETDGSLENCEYRTEVSFPLASRTDLRRWDSGSCQFVQQADPGLCSGDS